MGSLKNINDEAKYSGPKRWKWNWEWAYQDRPEGYRLFGPVGRKKLVCPSGTHFTALISQCLVTRSVSLFLIHNRNPFYCTCHSRASFLQWRVSKGPHNAPQEPFSLKVIHFWSSSAHLNAPTLGHKPTLPSSASDSAMLQYMKIETLWLLSDVGLIHMFVCGELGVGSSFPL